MLELLNAGLLPDEGIYCYWKVVADIYSGLQKPEGVESDWDMVRLSQSNGVLRVEHYAPQESHRRMWEVGRFSTSWDPHGVKKEQWFSECFLLCKEEEYTSGSGATGSHTYIVAYQGHVEVNYNRRDVPSWCGPLQNPILPGRIEATHWLPQGARGYAISATCIAEDVAQLIRIELGEKEPPEPTVCRHNPTVSVGIVTSDPAGLPRLLCTFCRGRGVKWEEFVRRNRADTCPYFRRACKSVTEKSDQLPSWFEWQGGGLLTVYRRLADAGHEAFEVVFLRKRDQFVKRCVVLFDNTTQSAWMFRYNGYIPPKLSEFRMKYTEGRQITPTSSS